MAAPHARPTRPSSILNSTAVGFITAAAVIALCEMVGTHGLKSALEVAIVAWAAGPLVVSITNGLWVRIDPVRHHFRALPGLSPCAS